MDALSIVSTILLILFIVICTAVIMLALADHQMRANKAEDDKVR